MRAGTVHPEATNAGVSVRAPQDGGVEAAGGTEIVDVAAPAGHEPRVLAPPDLGTHVPRRHRSASPLDQAGELPREAVEALVVDRVHACRAGSRGVVEVVVGEDRLVRRAAELGKDTLEDCAVRLVEPELGGEKGPVEGTVQAAFPVEPSDLDLGVGEARDDVAP